MKALFVNQEIIVVGLYFQMLMRFKEYLALTLNLHPHIVAQLIFGHTNSVPEIMDWHCRCKWVDK